MSNKKITRIAMLLALSIVLGIIESFFPVFNGNIPGLKIGLANIIVIYTLYTYDFKNALFISIMRVFIVGILRTGLFNYPFFFSLSGAIVSIIIMTLAKKIKIFSVIGVSIFGAISHNITQILVAYLLLKVSGVFAYLPYLLLFSIPTGIIIGYISKKIIDRYKI